MKLSDFENYEYKGEIQLHEFHESPVFKKFREMSTGHYFQVSGELMKFRKTLSVDEAAEYGEMQSLEEE